MSVYNLLIDFKRTITGSFVGFAVSLGFFLGWKGVDKFGENPDVDTGTTPEDITEIGGEYQWLAKTDPPSINKASSSNSADIGQLIEVWGIRDPETSEGNDLGYFVTNGQNKVDIFDNPELTGDPISFWRTDRMSNESDEGNDLQGDLYVYIDTAISGGVPTDITKVRAKVTNGNNQTLMAVYTTRPKTVGFLFKGELGGSRSQNSGQIQCAYYSRRYGKCFKVKKRVDITNQGSSVYVDKRSFPDRIPALTDIKLTVESVSANNTGTFGTFDVLEIDEKYFSKRFLRSIGQPGY